MTEQENERERRYFVTATGQKVPIRPVSITKMDLVRAGARHELIAAGRPVDPPTYDVQIVGGNQETFPHDETTLEIRPEDTGIADAEAAKAEAEARTLENRKAWAGHQAALQDLRRITNDRMTRLLLSGIDVEVPQDGWEEEQRSLGIQIPTDAAGRRHHYLTTEVLLGMEDFLAATQAITALSYEGIVQEDDIAAAMDSFRRELQGTAAGDGDAGPMADEREAGDHPRGEVLGDDPGTVAEQLLRGPGPDGGARSDLGPDGAAGTQGKSGPKRPRSRKTAA